MVNNIIEIFDLSKNYLIKGRNKLVVALENVNFSIKEGEIFGLLGPNGAGKTTLIKILTTLLRPSSGYALIDGDNILKNMKRIRNNIALMLDNQMLYYRITGYDNLKFCCKVYNISNYKEKILRISKEFGLEKWLNQYVHNYSTGMKIKLALCRTLLLNRKILFLDEPTLGLDITSKALIVDNLKKLNKTIFLSSHDMSIVEKLCNRIAFINKGIILKIGTPNDIKHFMQKEIKIQIGVVDKKNQLISELKGKDFISDIMYNNNDIIISIKNRENFQDLFMILSKYNVIKFKEQDLSLEDLFLKLI